jgi:Protein kinase domain
VSEDVPAAPGEFAAGTRIAGYLLQEQIGRGGMAVVYSAHDERLDRLVALKIMAPGLSLDDSFRQRFIGEWRAAAAVDDPHIIPVFEAGESDGALFIAMRLVRGGDVGSLLDRAGPLTPGRASEIVSQVASALDAAHARGLVHRDVKPANMLLDAREGSGRPVHVYLSDFGLSKASLAPSGLTATGQFLGTLDYVAPEQIEGRPLDGRADQYALACAAFELLSGAPPFGRDRGLAVIYDQLSETPAALSSRRHGLPAAVDGVVARALAKSPTDRYPTCRDFAAAMRQALGLRSAEPGASREPAPARPRTEIVTPAAVAAAPDLARPVRQPTEAAAVTPAVSPQEFARPGTAGAAQAASPPELATGRPWWRTRAAIGGLAAGVLVIAGGGWALLHHSAGTSAAGNLAGAGSNSGTGGAGGSTGLVAAVAVPGCTTKTASAPFISNASSTSVPLAGSPFAAVASNDGRYTFVSLGNSMAVLSNGKGLAPALVRTFPVAGAKAGEAITHNGKYVLAADGSGAAVVSVAAAETRGANPVVGVLTSAQGKGANQVAISADDKFAFVSLQASQEIGVFNLGDALADGFARGSLVGYVPIGEPTYSIIGSPDGKWLYVASFTTSEDVNNPGQGTLSVLSVNAAETSPTSAVVSHTDAGCGPVRVITSADGSIVWVAARQSDSLLAFSAAKLRSDPGSALLAKVAVGANPVGMALFDSGTRLMVADSNIDMVKGAVPNLAVIGTKAALAGKPSLVGLVKSGQVPRQVLLVPGDRVLLVTNTTSQELQAVRVADLP